MKKYQELENKVKEIQAEIDRLKKEEEKENELPRDFKLNHALRFLKSFSTNNLESAFEWFHTPQGHDYWFDIYKNLNIDDEHVVPDKAIIQIQKWVILYYQDTENKN
jgi:molecular chaperone GrpE (heat shock protein)